MADRSGKDKPIPTVGVVMPTYNGQSHVRAQLDSILDQSRPPDRIVIVDDKSSDRTPTILSTYATRHSRIHYIRNETNLGWIKNFEKAIRLCDTDIVAIADQDDLWRSDKIDCCLSALSGVAGPALCYHDATFVDGNGGELLSSLGQENVEPFPVPSDRLRRSIADTQTPIPGFLMVINRALKEMAMPFPGETFCPHDWWLNAIGVFLGTTVYVDDRLVAHRIHAGQTIGDFRSRLFGGKRAAEGKATIGWRAVQMKVAREVMRVVRYRHIKRQKIQDAHRRQTEFAMAFRRLMDLVESEEAGASPAVMSLIEGGLAKLRSAAL